MIVTNRKILHQVSDKVQTISEAKEIIEKLEKELSKHKTAAGISAIQIGIPKQVAIIKSNDKNTKNIYLINCYIFDGSKEMVYVEEGCLSFPNKNFTIRRHQEITIRNNIIEGDHFIEQTAVSYYDQESKNKNLECIIIQHELDHMKGITVEDKSYQPPQAISHKIGRNEPCVCGSGKKYKKCCGKE